MVEFEHNIFSGKRVLKVNGEVIYRVNLKFKLIGAIEFRIRSSTLVVNIEVDGEKNACAASERRTCNPASDTVDALASYEPSCSFTSTNRLLWRARLFFESGREADQTRA